MLSRSIQLVFSTIYMIQWIIYWVQWSSSIPPGSKLNISIEIPLSYPYLQFYSLNHHGCLLNDTIPPRYSTHWFWPYLQSSVVVLPHRQGHSQHISRPLETICDVTANRTLPERARSWSSGSVLSQDATYGWHFREIDKLQ